MKSSHFLFILLFLLLTHSTFFFIGKNYGIRASKDAIKLAFEAASEPYKNALQNEPINDYYGQGGRKKDTTIFLLPKNSRTEIANPRASTNRNKDKSHTQRNR